MPDMEKVIKGLEACTGEENDCAGHTCPYWDYDEDAGCRIRMELDALALLKEQEAIEPIYIENPYTHLPVSYCPKCREPINQYITGNPYRKTKYCHYCGQAVKWE